MNKPAVRINDSARATQGVPTDTTPAWWVRRLMQALFRHVRMDPVAVQRIRDLAERGPVVYVMRQRSWIDYLLVTHVLLREGLPIPVVAGGLSVEWLGSLRAWSSGLWAWLLAAVPRARKVRDFEDRERCARAVANGKPVLLFLRSRVPRLRFLTERRRALMDARTGSGYLREIAHHLWAPEHEVSLVPLAVFRGRGMRRRDARFQTVVYSVQEVPTELRRLFVHLWNPRETSVRVGDEVCLRDFVTRYGHEGEERLVRRLARALQIFLYREERLVWGPPLMSKRQARQRVLDDGEVRELVARIARETAQSETQVWRQARRYFDEMAANFSGFYFSIIAFLVNRLYPRVFQGLEYSGLEKVVECVREHPVVLVPCHRSHFDYLILSYIFHLNYLSPPHIAAGVNLSFWPLGPLFRGAGAYFIRRSFGDNRLYKMVFRQYLTFLIREGYTQEFFIEGGRSRTGKILTPKLGMLSAIVESFVTGVRRDLMLIPVSIQYGRVVEEQAYQRELSGARKERESLSTLFAARSVLRRRHGTAYVTFGEPISLNQALGDRKAYFGDTLDDQVLREKRRFIQKLGFQVLREVNRVAVAGATPVASTVLLGVGRDAMMQDEFVVRAAALTHYLRRLGTKFSTSLERNSQQGFKEILAFLASGGLLRFRSTENGHVVEVPPEKRLALDFYKNNTIHFFLLPSVVCNALLRGLRGAALHADVAWHLDLLRWEFPLPERDATAAKLALLLEYLHDVGALSDNDGTTTTDPAHPFIRSTRVVLDNFYEAYWVASRALSCLPEEGLTRSVVLDRMQERYRTGLALGEVLLPEGNSRVTLGNALNRFAEVGGVLLRPGSGKDQEVRRGEHFASLESIGDRITASLGRVTVASEAGLPCVDPVTDR